MAEVEPGWGSETRGGADRLWSRETMGGIATGTNGGRRLRARVGHGSSLSDNWIGTPGMTITECGAGRRLQFDYQVKPRNSERLDVGLSVVVERTTNKSGRGTRTSCGPKLE